MGKASRLDKLHATAGNECDVSVDYTLGPQPLSCSLGHGKVVLVPSMLVLINLVPAWLVLINLM